MKFKKKTILIIGTIGIVIFTALFIFDPGSRVDSGIAIAGMAFVMIISTKSDKFS